ATQATTAGALSPHPSGRVSGHKHRAIGITAPAGGETPEPCGSGRQRSGHLPLSWSFLRQLQNISATIRELERGGRLRAIPCGAEGELWCEDEHLARGHTGHGKEGGAPKIPEEDTTGKQGGGKKNPHWGNGNT